MSSGANRPERAEEVTLTMPRDRAFYTVAHLVLGGLGIRLHLTVESLDDLQLALDAVLERARDDGDVTISLRLTDGAIETVIGPMRDGVRAELESEEERKVGLRRILATLVDRVELEPGEDGAWVKLTKDVGDRGA